jgi:3-mercaptopyruvate sulfurtransferase SseA
LFVPRRPIPDAILRATLLLSLGGALGLAQNAARKDGVRPSAFAQPVECSGGDHAVAVEISPSDASAMCGKADVVVADARTPQRFSEGHVAGAVHLPCHADDPHSTAASLEVVAGRRTVIVYGDSTAEATPVALALQRRAPGVDVRVLSGGFPGWSQAGLACASGPCDSCVETRSR